MRRLVSPLKGFGLADMIMQSNFRSDSVNRQACDATFGKVCFWRRLRRQSNEFGEVLLSLLRVRRTKIVGKIAFQCHSFVITDVTLAPYNLATKENL